MKIHTRACVCVCVCTHYDFESSMIGQKHWFYVVVLLFIIELILFYKKSKDSILEFFSNYDNLRCFLEGFRRKQGKKLKFYFRKVDPFQYLQGKNHSKIVIFAKVMDV